MLQPNYRAAGLHDTPDSKGDILSPSTKRIVTHERHCIAKHFDVMSSIQIPGRTEYGMKMVGFKQGLTFRFDSCFVGKKKKSGFDSNKKLNWLRLGGYCCILQALSQKEFSKGRFLN